MNFDSLITEKITHLLEMKRYAYSMYLEVISQFRDMAYGGDGGTLGFWPDDWAQKTIDKFKPIKEPTIRTYNYPNLPDKYFEEVLHRMGKI